MSNSSGKRTIDIRKPYYSGVAGTGAPGSANYVPAMNMNEPTWNEMVRIHNTPLAAVKAYKLELDKKKPNYYGGGSMLPTTTWGEWLNHPGALAWSANSQAPAPIANGGLYTSPQSTGAWASSPFPATQYGLAVDAARTSGINDVFYQQHVMRPGNDFSPYVHTPISSQHTASAIRGGSRRKRTYARRKRTRRHK